MEMKTPKYSGALLTPEQILELAPAMSALVGHPAWQVYEELIAGMRSNAAEQSADAEEIDAVRHLRGVREGLLFAVQQPKRIIAAAEAEAHGEDLRGRPSNFRGSLAADASDPSF